MTYLIYDLIILVLLVVFALWGMHRGLIRSLLSLVTVVVAFAGAILISNLFAPTVAQWAEPAVAPTVQSAVESIIPDDLTGDLLSSDQLVILLEDAELPLGLNDVLADYLEENPLTLNIESAAQDLTGILVEKVTLALAYVILFLVAFVVIVILWNLIIRALNLVAKLPGLHALNKLGGFLFGVIKGALLLFILAWILRTVGSDWLPAGVSEETTLFRFFMTVNPLDYLAKL